MPELPEVETFRRALDRRKPRSPIARAEVRKTYLLRTPAATLEKALPGQRLGATVRRGKELFVRLEPSGQWLRVHFGMDGDWDFGRTGGALPPYAVLVLDFEDGQRLCYTSFRLLGALGLVPDAAAWVAEKGLGPDALEAPAAQVVAALREKRGAIKAALLDQGCLAGVGNLYADEALFQAGLHPKAAVQGLDDAALGRFVARLRRILATAVQRRALYADYPRTWFLHRRGPGGKCPRDGAPLVQSVVGGRTTFHCPRHQRVPRRTRAAPRPPRAPRGARPRSGPRPRERRRRLRRSRPRGRSPGARRWPSPGRRRPPRRARRRR